MHPSLYFALSLLAGLGTTLAIPPFGFWWLGIIALAVFAFNLHRHSDKKNLLIHSLLFAMGLFGAGSSWVFVSIFEFGNTSFTIALAMTFTFVLVNAVFFSLPFIVLSYFKQNHWRLLLGFPFVWVLSEWIRSWIFTGFPWLYLGYGYIDIPLSGWAPIGGVFFLSLIGAFYSATLCLLFLPKINSTVKILAVITIAMFWAEGKALTTFEWTKAKGRPIKVGIVQPNIPQELKWSPEFRQPTFDILTSLSNDLWKQDLIIWPEAAIPDIYSRSQNFLNLINNKALETNTGIITGILYDDRSQQKYFNSLSGLGLAEGLYFKQRLVPFGEYVPLEFYLRGILNFFNLPTSIIAKGHGKQQALALGELSIASAICYEIVYPALVAKETKNRDFIVTVSNDAWFGESIGPLQHFHMSRMRAIETGRYLIRGTNNGVSALVNPKGVIEHQSEQFIETVLLGEISAMEGNTPFLIWRNYFILSLLLLIFVALYKTSKKNNDK